MNETLFASTHVKLSSWEALQLIKRNNDRSCPAESCNKSWLFRSMHFPYAPENTGWLSWKLLAHIKRRVYNEINGLLSAQKCQILFPLLNIHEIASKIPWMISHPGFITGVRHQFVTNVLRILRPLRILRVMKQPRSLRQQWWSWGNLIYPDLISGYLRSLGACPRDILENPENSENSEEMSWSQDNNPQERISTFAFLNRSFPSQ